MSISPLAKRLRELRKSYNYSQQRVADELNVIRQTYSHYETGRYVPNAEVLYKLSRLYDIPPESLLKLTLSAEDSTRYYDTSALPKENAFSQFLDYVTAPEHAKKFRNLDKKEKELIYYFDLLSDQDQEDILDFLKIKVNRH